MGTTIAEIRGWLERAKAQNASHLIVAVDTFDFEDYPVFVPEGANARAMYDGLQAQPMTRVMEVYDVRLPWDTQLAEYRAFHLT